MGQNTSKTISKVKYYCSYHQNKKIDTVSIKPIGIDTEAYSTGVCFVICTSEGDVIRQGDFPRALFSRKYRQQNFVAWNLRYDAGAFIQTLPTINKQQLRERSSTEYNGYKWKIIGNKCLTIRRGKNAIHFYDIMTFYGGSLDYNAKKYLGETKIEIETKTFTPAYVDQNWNQITEYCIQDAVLTKKLAQLMIDKFEKFGVYPRRLYSTAYISYQYFKSKCIYPVVRRYWNNYRKVLEYAMLSYNGGKFEITQKGPGYYYEYDIVSAYPYEIRNLVDITHARVIQSSKYRKYAVYGFLHCEMNIPLEVSSPIAVNINNVNTYPAGYVKKVITMKEYEYLTSLGVDIKILNGWWLHIDKKTYPFRKEIENLVQYKHEFKEKGLSLDYKTIKIFLNSLYGKFVQLIPKKDHWVASSCWNPVYGTVITANTRIRVSKMQQTYDSVRAVHTDSIITDKRLNIATGSELGDFEFVAEGEGLILNCGIYQIGDITKIRGFRYKGNLTDVVNVPGEYAEIDITKVHSWREVIFHGWPDSKINLFENLTKKLRANSDQKRLWIQDYKNISESLNRTVTSLPHYMTQSGI